MISRSIKKIIVSFSLVLASALYILFGTPEAPATVMPLSSQNQPPQVAVTPSTTPPPPKPNGMYTDGTYTGKVADAYYGLVQVQTVIQSGRLTNVTFLQYPNDRRTSQRINGQAMPFLKSEAIQAQSANVDIVSGATDTSMAFQQSLADALAQAKF